MVEDYDFWLRAYQEYRFYYLDDYLYFYRIHENSLTAERKKLVEIATAKLLEKNINYVTDKEMKMRVQKRIKRLKSNSK